MVEWTCACGSKEYYSNGRCRACTSRYNTLKRDDERVLRRILFKRIETVWKRMEYLTTLKEAIAPELWERLKEEVENSGERLPKLLGSHRIGRRGNNKTWQLYYTLSDGVPRRTLTTYLDNLIFQVKTTKFPVIPLRLGRKEKRQRCFGSFGGFGRVWVCGG